MKPTYNYAAVVNRVVDGDTVNMTLDLGFRVSWKTNCRLARLNAPEMNTPEGVEAKQWLYSMLASGKQVVITSAALDKYGRGLVEIFLGDVNINDALIASGHAKPWDGQGAKP